MPWLRRRRQPVPLEAHDPADLPRRVPDDLPRDDLFSQPLRVDRIKVREPEALDDGWRVAFVVFIRDAAGRTCPDLAVDATITGPQRTAAGQTTTDLMGRATFRMQGPAGTYQLHVDDVAAGALTWDTSTNTATATVP